MSVKVGVPLTEAITRLLRDGFGIGALPPALVHDELKQGLLTILDEVPEPPPLPVQLVVPGGRQPAPRVRAFIDHAVARLPELAPIGPGASAARPQSS